MSLSGTPTGERVHIGFFGVRNAGKSSLVNAITNQSLSVVSDVKGTTTDPVKKTMELLPLGPVMLFDTPGLDDVGELGELRVAKTYETLRKTDLAVFVTDGSRDFLSEETAFLKELVKRGTPFVLVYNKADLIADCTRQDGLYVSATTGEGIHALKEWLAKKGMEAKKEKPLLEGLIDPGDTAVLVIPIDKAAPKGRIILPQQQTIRALLDTGAKALVCRDVELADTLATMQAPPKLVITDSQVFGKVAAIVPESVAMTSFSIIFARYKGDLAQTIQGVAALEHLKDGDQVLIAEGCTHHRQCDDIGTVKIPGWIRKQTGKDLDFTFTSGGGFPQDLPPYSLIVHCGGCMLNEKEVQYRFREAQSQGVPITNYGILIAYLNGILKRSLMPFGGMDAFLDNVF